jgi:regulator of nucleoside diphosphate kinase
MEEKTVYLTYIDLKRLKRVISLYGDFVNTEDLECLLSRAQLLSSQAIPAHVVTMNSDVLLKNSLTGELSLVKLVYPKNGALDPGRVSILEQNGISLLGLSVGQTLDWEMPLGGVQQFQVMSVLYQPEAAGDWHL